MSSTQFLLYLSKRKSLKMDCKFTAVKDDWIEFSTNSYESNRVFRQSHYKALSDGKHVFVKEEWHVDVQAWWQFRMNQLDHKLNILKENGLISDT